MPTTASTYRARRRIFCECHRPPASVDPASHSFVSEPGQEVKRVWTPNPLHNKAQSKAHAAAIMIIRDFDITYGEALAPAVRFWVDRGRPGRAGRGASIVCRVEERQELEKMRLLCTLILCFSFRMLDCSDVICTGLFCFCRSHDAM